MAEVFLAVNVKIIWKVKPALSVVFSRTVTIHLVLTNLAVAVMVLAVGGGGSGRSGVSAMEF